MINDIQPLKPPKKFEEQLEILKSRGLIINNESFALEILKRINYYRLTGYMLSFKTPEDAFLQNITFEDIYSIYLFDKKLRLLLLEKIEDIEIEFRTHICYYIAHEYGSLGYKDSKNFNDEQWFNQFLLGLKDNIDKNKNRELFVGHHLEKYSGEFPIWVIIEILSFGSLSMLFKNMKLEDKKTICDGYYKIPSEYIESWLHYLSYIRNVCAHYSRLYNKPLKVFPKFSKSDKKSFNSTHKIFDAIFILKKILEKKEFLDLNTKLKILLNQYSNVDLKSLGFPQNWLELLN
jgi:abortive infection bacteriophage resistance protein